MRRFAMKAVITAFTIKRTERTRPDWDRIILVASMCMTAALVLLYVHGKIASRW